MNIWWIHNKTNDLFDDSICIGETLYFVKARARGHKSITDISKQTRKVKYCELCNIHRFPLELHHIIPIWAFILDKMGEYLIQNLHRNPRELDLFKIFDSCDFEFINNPMNLVSVCYWCHQKMEKVAYRHYKNYIHFKYYPRLAYSYQQLKKQYKKDYAMMEEL